MGFLELAKKYDEIRKNVMLYNIAKEVEEEKPLAYAIKIFILY